MDNNKKIPVPIATILDDEGMGLLAIENPTILRRSTLSTAQQAETIDGKICIWTSTTNKNGVVMCLLPYGGKSGRLPYNDKIALYPAVSASSISGLDVNTHNMEDLLWTYVKLPYEVISKYSDYETQQLIVSAQQNNQLKPTGKTYPIFNKEKKSLENVNEMQMPDGTKCVLINEIGFLVVQAEGYWVPDEHNQPYAVITNTVSVLPLETDYRKHTGILNEMFVGREFFPAYSLSLLPTEQYLLVKQELEKSQHPKEMPVVRKEADMPSQATEILRDPGIRHN